MMMMMKKTMMKDLVCKYSFNRLCSVIQHLHTQHGISVGSRPPYHQTTTTQSLLLVSTSINRFLWWLLIDFEIFIFSSVYKTTTFCFFFQQQQSSVFAWKGNAKEEEKRKWMGKEEKTNHNIFCRHSQRQHRHSWRNPQKRSQKRRKMASRSE